MKNSGARNPRLPALAVLKMQCNVQSVTLIMAMEQEAAPIVARFALQRVEESFLHGAPFVAWTGLAEKGLKLNVVWCGYDKRFGVNNVATTAAAVAAYAAVVAFGRVDLIISAGTAGAFGQRGAKICDVFMSSKCIFHSRRIPDSVTGVLEEYGFGHFRSPPLYRLAREVGLHVGVVSTADSLDCNPTDMSLLLAEGAVVKEMEAAAVAWVCQQLAIPFIALKAVTDIIDGGEPTREQFDRNLATAAQALQVKLALLLELVGGTPLASWCDVGYSAPAPSLLRAAEDALRAASESPPAGFASRRAKPATALVPRPWWRAEAPLGYAGWALALALGVGMAWMQRGGGTALRMSNRATRR